MPRTLNGSSFPKEVEMATAAAGGRAIPRPGHGWIVFAGIMMIISGAMNVLDGLWALDHDKTPVDSLLYSSSLTGWGWFYLIVGIVLIGVGIGILRGASWALWAGVFAAAIGVLLQMLWVFAYPITSLVLMGVDILVIYALLVHGDTMEEVG
jgi:hypothetical protein